MLFVLGIACGVVIGCLVLVTLVLPGSDDDGGDEVLQLERRGSAGVDPFTSDFSKAPESELASFAESRRDSGVATASTASTDTGGGAEENVGVVSVTGSAPGLYGGSRDDTVCDRAALANFLAEERAKAEAFGSVVGVPAPEVADYVEVLAPLVLPADTLVTNHGFRDGRATPRLSVLEAGTTVLVDDLGIPRVRCSCGNPLAPAPAELGAVRISGDPWQGFDPASVLEITPAEAPVTSLTAVELDGGNPLPVVVGELDQSIRRFDFANIRFDIAPTDSLCHAEGVALTGGTTELPGPEGMTLRIAADTPMFADLDGDGFEDAGVLVQCFLNADYSTSEVVVFRWDPGPGQPVYVGRAAFSENETAVIDEASSEPGVVVVRAHRCGVQDFCYYTPSTPYRISVTVRDGAVREEAALELPDPPGDTRGLVLELDGLGLVDLGASTAEVESAVGEVLGPPDDRGTGCELGGPGETFIRWQAPDGWLTVSFFNDEMTGWGVTTPAIDGVALRTARGVGPGVSEGGFWAVAAAENWTVEAWDADLREMFLDDSTSAYWVAEHFSVEIVDEVVTRVDLNLAFCE